MMLFMPFHPFIHVLHAWGIIWLFSWNYTGFKSSHVHFCTRSQCHLRGKVLSFSLPSLSVCFDLMEISLLWRGSILVRTTEWKKIEANMPWLLDAAVCVLLDLFVSFDCLQVLWKHLTYVHCPLHLNPNQNRLYCSTCTTNTSERRIQVLATTWETVAANKAVAAWLLTVLDNLDLCYLTLPIYSSTVSEIVCWTYSWTVSCLCFCL